MVNKSVVGLVALVMAAVFVLFDYKNFRSVKKAPQPIRLPMRHIDLEPLVDSPALTPFGSVQSLLMNTEVT